MKPDAPTIVYHLDYNSREVQEWLAQAWDAGYQAGWGDYMDECPETSINPFRTETP